MRFTASQRQWWRYFLRRYEIKTVCIVIYWATESEARNGAGMKFYLCLFLSQNNIKLCVWITQHKRATLFYLCMFIVFPALSSLISAKQRNRFNLEHSNLAFWLVLKLITTAISLGMKILWKQKSGDKNDSCLLLGLGVGAAAAAACE